MRFFFVLVCILACLTTVILIGLVVERAMGGENLVLPAFGLVVTTNTIIDLFISLDAFAIGLGALIRKALRSTG